MASLLRQLSWYRSATRSVPLRPACGLSKTGRWARYCSAKVRFLPSLLCFVECRRYCHVVLKLTRPTRSGGGRLARPPGRLRGPAGFTDEQRAIQQGNGCTMAVIAGTGMSDPTLLGRLDAVNVPALMVWGASDGVVTWRTGGLLRRPCPARSSRRSRPPATTRTSKPPRPPGRRSTRSWPGSRRYGLPLTRRCRAGRS